MLELPRNILKIYERKQYFGLAGIVFTIDREMLPLHISSIKALSFSRNLFSLPPATCKIFRYSEFYVFILIIIKMDC